MIERTGEGPCPPLDLPRIGIQLIVWVLVLVIVGVLVWRGYDAGVAISLAAATATVSAEVARRLLAPGSGNLV